MTLFIGLMSGTSMDGIDAALVDVETHRLIKGITCAYSEFARNFLDDVLNERLTGFRVMSQLNTILGREFAFVVEQLLKVTDVKPHQIKAIGSHGQTIEHNATAEIPYTIQLGCGHTIAALTGITVVADFRARDLVLGGQGAPFAPLYHQALFEPRKAPLAVVNIGGIANITFIAPGKNVNGYDTGPGNCLLDTWTQMHRQKPYDAGGAWGASGRVIEPLLQQLLADPYFKLPAPKSLDKAYFSGQWLRPHLCSEYLAQDVQATLVALTAISIGDAIKGSEFEPVHVVICGGGVHNHALLRAIKEQLPEIAVDNTNALGVDPDFLEAMMFAWLADKTLKQESLDLTLITGAKRPSVLGAIYASGIMPLL
jgi:anhydro-N-acetylmuramic acid kinase